MRGRVPPRALLGVLALAACAPARGASYERSVAEASAAHHDGRFAEAAMRYEEAAKSAKVPRDAVYRRYTAALDWIRAGDIGRGTAELRTIARAKPPNEYSPQAAFQVARLTRRGDNAAGLAALEAVLLEFPNSGVAQVALWHLLQEDDAAGPELALAHLERLTPRVNGTGVEENVAYERARHLDTLGRTEQARDAYLDTAARFPYPTGAFNDNSLFRAAEMEDKLGQRQRAIALLQRLLSQREVSGFVGTYERPQYRPALLKIVELYERSGDRASARAALHRVYTELTTSTVRDDALWREAALWRQDGDAATACARLSTLATDFPDSRYVPCATQHCPSVKRSAKSKAPATCHAYLKEPSGSGSESQATTHEHLTR